MTVEEKVQAKLVAATALTAVVPASRIRVPGDWQGLQAPYIVHKPVAARASEAHHGGLLALRIWEWYQVSVFAASYSSGRAITELIIAALIGNSADMHCQWRGGNVYLGRNDAIGLEEFATNFLISEVVS